MDKQRWISTLAASAMFVGVVTLGVGAQTAGAPASPPRPVAASASPMTVIGCIELTEQSPVGTSGTLGSAGVAAPDTTFILTHASMTPATPATGTATPVAPSTYRVEVENEGRVWAHVGHKVEIVGTLEDRDVGGVLPMVKVTSIRMVSASCAD